jgi:ABC-type spermidine/putrescine transport system permease subunit II
MGYKHNLITTYICVLLGYVLLAACHFNSFITYFYILFLLVVIPGYVIGSTALIVYMHLQKPQKRTTLQGHMLCRNDDATTKPQAPT